MSYIESDFCPPEEYTRSEDDRLQAYDLVEGEIYTVLVALSSTIPNRQAAKFPSRFHSVEEDDDSGICQVKFTALTADLQPEIKVNASFDDGYWESPGLRVQSFRIIKGYFSDYDDGISSRLAEFTGALLNVG